jgi:hypothetical protein
LEAADASPEAARTIDADRSSSDLGRHLLVAEAGAAVVTAALAALRRRAAAA